MRTRCSKRSTYSRRRRLLSASALLWLVHSWVVISTWRFCRVANAYPGCTYTTAANFDPFASEDDGTCVFIASPPPAPPISPTQYRALGGITQFDPESVQVNNVEGQVAKLSVTKQGGDGREISVSWEVLNAEKAEEAARKHNVAGNVTALTEGVDTNADVFVNSGTITWQALDKNATEAEKRASRTLEINLHTRLDALYERNELVVVRLEEAGADGLIGARDHAFIRVSEGVTRVGFRANMCVNINGTRVTRYEAGVDVYPGNLCLNGTLEMGVREENKVVQVAVFREGDIGGDVEVEWRTVLRSPSDKSASSRNWDVATMDDFTFVHRGVLLLRAGRTRETIVVKIEDDQVYERVGEVFDIELVRILSPQGRLDDGTAELSGLLTANVIIVAPSDIVRCHNTLTAKTTMIDLLMYNTSLTQEQLESEIAAAGLPPRYEASPVGVSVGLPNTTAGKPGYPAMPQFAYEWDFALKPNGSLAAFEISGLNASFTPDVPGRYDVRVVADSGNCDGRGQRAVEAISTLFASCNAAPRVLLEDVVLGGGEHCIAVRGVRLVGDLRQVNNATIRWGIEPYRLKSTGRLLSSWTTASMSSDLQVTIKSIHAATYSVSVLVGDGCLGQTRAIQQLVSTPWSDECTSQAMSAPITVLALLWFAFLATSFAASRLAVQGDTGGSFSTAHLVADVVTLEEADALHVLRHQSIVHVDGRARSMPPVDVSQLSVEAHAVLGDNQEKDSGADGDDELSDAEDDSDNDSDTEESHNTKTRAPRWARRVRRRVAGGIKRSFWIARVSSIFGLHPYNAMAYLRGNRRVFKVDLDKLKIVESETLRTGALFAMSCAGLFTEIVQYVLLSFHPERARGADGNAYAVLALNPADGSCVLAAVALSFPAVSIAVSILWIWQADIMIASVASAYLASADALANMMKSEEEEDLEKATQKAIAERDAKGGADALADKSAAGNGFSDRLRAAATEAARRGGNGRDAKRGYADSSDRLTVIDLVVMQRLGNARCQYPQDRQHKSRRRTNREPLNSLRVLVSLPSFAAQLLFLDIFALPAMQCCLSLVTCRYLDDAKPFPYLVRDENVVCWSGVHVMLAFYAIIAFTAVAWISVEYAAAGRWLATLPYVRVSGAHAQGAALLKIVTALAWASFADTGPLHKSELAATLALVRDTVVALAAFFACTYHLRDVPFRGISAIPSALRAASPAALAASSFARLISSSPSVAVALAVTAAVIAVWMDRQSSAEVRLSTPRRMMSVDRISQGVRSRFLAFAVVCRRYDRLGLIQSLPGLRVVLGNTNEVFDSAPPIEEAALLDMVMRVFSHEHFGSYACSDRLRVACMRRLGYLARNSEQERLTLACRFGCLRHVCRMADTDGESPIVRAAAVDVLAEFSVSQIGLKELLAADAEEPTVSPSLARWARELGVNVPIDDPELVAHWDELDGANSGAPDMSKARKLLDEDYDSVAGSDAGDSDAGSDVDEDKSGKQGASQDHSSDAGSSRNGSEVFLAAEMKRRVDEMPRLYPTYEKYRKLQKRLKVVQSSSGPLGVLLSLPPDARRTMTFKNAIFCCLGGARDNSVVPFGHGFVPAFVGARSPFHVELALALADAAMQYGLVLDAETRVERLGRQVQLSRAMAIVRFRTTTLALSRTVRNTLVSASRMSREWLGSQERAASRGGAVRWPRYEAESTETRLATLRDRVPCWPCRTLAHCLSISRPEAPRALFAVRGIAARGGQRGISQLMASGGVPPLLALKGQPQPDLRTSSSECLDYIAQHSDPNNFVHTLKVVCSNVDGDAGSRAASVGLLAQLLPQVQPIDDVGNPGAAAAAARRGAAPGKVARRPATGTGWTSAVEADLLAVDTDPAVRRAEVLGVVMSSADLLSTLVALLRDPNAAVRASCAALFHTIGAFVDEDDAKFLKTRDSEGYMLVDALRALCNDGDNAVRRAAEGALLTFMSKGKAARDILHESEPAAASAAARRVRDEYVSRLREYHRGGEASGGVAAPAPPPRAQRAIVQFRQDVVRGVNALRIPEYMAHAHLENASRQHHVEDSYFANRDLASAVVAETNNAFRDYNAPPSRRSRGGSRIPQSSRQGQGRRVVDPSAPRVPNWLSTDFDGDLEMALPGGVSMSFGYGYDDDTYLSSQTMTRARPRYVATPTANGESGGELEDDVFDENAHIPLGF
ncbi:hypothetical protein NFJ02_02g70670 [Pycnococcus provasolii]